MSPTGAFRLGERAADPIQMYLSDIFTVGAPLAGLPAITVPCGLTPGNLPVGLQLTGRRFEESTRYRIAAAYERHAEDGIGVPPRFAAPERRLPSPNALRAPGTGPRIVSAPPIRSRIR